MFSNMASMTNLDLSVAWYQISFRYIYTCSHIQQVFTNLNLACFDTFNVETVFKAMFSGASGHWGAGFILFVLNNYADTNKYVL